MFYLILILIIILTAIGAVIGRFALKGDVATVVTLIIGLFVYGILMPSNLFQLSTVMYNPFSALLFVLGLIMLYIFAGLIMATGYRLNKLRTKVGRTNIDLAVAIGGFLIFLSPIIWLISLILDIMSLYAFRVQIPHLYNLFLWTVITCILIATKIFAIDKGTVSNVAGPSVVKKIQKKTDAQKVAERKADVILYKDNLEGLDEDLKSGIVNKERYAQILCDIEMGDGE